MMDLSFWFSSVGDQVTAKDLEIGMVFYSPKVEPRFQMIQYIEKSEVVKTGKQISSPRFSQNDLIWVFPVNDETRLMMKNFVAEENLLRQLSPERLLKLANECQWAEQDEREARTFDDRPNSNFGSDSKKTRLKKLVAEAQKRGIFVSDEILEVAHV